MFANLKSFAFQPTWRLLLFRSKEIDRNDLFGDLAAHCSDLFVLRMLIVLMQGRAICELGNEARVERTIKVQNILADIETEDI